MKNTELEAKCKLYGLKPYSGKRKEILVAMLMEFSALGNDGWKEQCVPFNHTVPSLLLIVYESLASLLELAWPTLDPALARKH